MIFLWRDTDLLQQQYRIPTKSNKSWIRHPDNGRILSLKPNG